MSETPDENQPPFFLHVTEEMRAKMNAAYEDHVVQVHDFQHTIEEAWNELDHHQLFAIAQWLQRLSSTDPNFVMASASYTAGSLYRLAAFKSKTCVVCDKNHDDEAAKLLTDSVENVQIEPPNDGLGNSLDDRAIAVIIKEHEDKMKEYTLGQTDNGSFYCTECGMPHHSLEDRMLKPAGADGCPGCQHKAKWG